MRIHDLGIIALRPSTRRRVRFWAWTLTFLAVLVVVLSNRWVINSTDAYLYAYHDWSLLPQNEIGVVLGASAYTDEGKPSSEFHGRIRAAAELYKLGKVKVLIVSGANPDETYNEPRRMWRELVKAGVPPAVIKMDFAGFRTLDSIVRAQAVWGQSRFTVITQRYHAYRAVFIGRKLGLSVVAYLAPLGKTGDEPGSRNPPREILARTKSVLDLVFLGTQPKFLGQPESVEILPDAEDVTPDPLEAPPTPL